jgi:hypothetical protein
MAFRMPIDRLLAAALGFTTVLALAAAKPGDMPIKRLIGCEEEQTLTASLLVGVGVNSDAGLSGTIVTDDQPRRAEEEQAFETIDTVCPCFFGVIQRWWQSLIGSRPTQTEAEEEGLSCPYLKQKSDPNTPKPDALTEKPMTVLDNLEKLVKAKELYGQADFYRRTGHPKSALYYYQLIRDQCPGSRYGQMAAQQIDALQAQPASATSFAVPEEQQLVPDRPSDERWLQDSTEIQDDLRELERLWERIWFIDSPSGLTPERVRGGIQESRLQPAVPSLDPAVVAALEKILAKSGDPEMPKLILQADSADDDAEPEELDPALGWLPGTSEEQVFEEEVCPADPNRPLDVDDSDDDGDEELFTEFIPDWNQVMQEVMDAVGAGTCVEIDGSNLGRLRFLCQKQVGAVTVRIFSDSDGVWRCVVASVDPEASSDLRTVQRAFNDRISRWIEALSAGAGEDTWDEDEDWTQDDGDPDDDDIGSRS